VQQGAYALGLMFFGQVEQLDGLQKVEGEDAEQGVDVVGGEVLAGRAVQPEVGEKLDVMFTAFIHFALAIDMLSLC